MSDRTGATQQSEQILTLNASHRVPPSFTRGTRRKIPQGNEIKFPPNHHQADNNTSREQFRWGLSSKKRKAAFSCAPTPARLRARCMAEGSPARFAGRQPRPKLQKSHHAQQALQGAVSQALSTAVPAAMYHHHRAICQDRNRRTAHYLFRIV